MRTIVTTMKDEGPFILEWVAYHQSIGFDHFIINTNDCADGTDHIVLRLQELGIATHIDNPGPWKQGPQGAAYTNAMAHPKLEDATWILVCDADEFLNIKTGDGTLEALFARCPEANMFSFTWQLFGHNGVVEFKDEFVTEQFTRAVNPYQFWPATCRALKTLYHRDAPFSSISTHRPKKLDKSKINDLRWVDGDGDEMGKTFARFGWQATNHGVGFGNEIARMHHYAVRSLNSYLMKRLRGDVRTTAYHRKLEETGVDYWLLHCWNSVENDTILRNIPRARLAFDQLKRDPELSALHDKAVAHHSTKIAALERLETAKDFTARFKGHVAGYALTPEHDIVTCPDLALDDINFDRTTFREFLRAARQQSVAVSRKHRVFPWFAVSDVTGVDFRDPELAKIEDAAKAEAFALAREAAKSAAEALSQARVTDDAQDLATPDTKMAEVELSTMPETTDGGTVMDQSEGKPDANGNSTEEAPNGQLKQHEIGLAQRPVISPDDDSSAEPKEQETATASNVSSGPQDTNEPKEELKYKWRAEIPEFKRLKFSIHPNRRKAREKFLNTVPDNAEKWALINSGDPGLVERILANENLKTLFIYNAWGYRVTHPFVNFSNQRLIPDFLAQDMAYLEFIDRFHEQIKSKRLIVRRGDPYFSLKVLQNAYVGAAFIAGNLPYPNALRLIRRTLNKVKPGGLLLMDSYHRHGKNRDSSMRALHMIASENASLVRFTSIMGAHCSLQVLNALGDEGM